MEDRETARMRKYGESKTTRVMMATVPHVTSGLGLRKFQADGFLLTRVYVTRNSLHRAWCLQIHQNTVVEREPLYTFDVTNRRGLNTTVSRRILVTSTSQLRVSCPRHYVTLVGHAVTVLTGGCCAVRNIRLGSGSNILLRNTGTLCRHTQQRATRCGSSEPSTNV